MSAAGPSPILGEPPSTPALSLDSNIGAFALGTFIGLILYGVTVLQLYQYMRQFPKDSWVIKGLVISVMILNTFHAIASMHACYYYLVTHYAQPAFVISGVWSLSILPAIAALADMTAECFFARRAILIGHNSKIIAIVAITFLVAGSGLGTAVTVQGFRFEQLSTFGEKTKLATILTLALAALGDYLLAGTIIASLYRNRATRASMSALDVMTLYILNTGLLNGVMQGIAAILAIRYPLTLYWGAVGVVSTRIYPVTLLSVLNARNLMVNRGIIIFSDNSESYGPNILSRVNRLATAERWNVPQAPDDGLPPVINVKVAAEIEVHGQSDGDSIRNYDVKGLPSTAP